MSHYAWVLEVRPGYEEEYKKHISLIDQENNKLDFKNRSCEVKNWLELI